VLLLLSFFVCPHFNTFQKEKIVKKFSWTLFIVVVLAVVVVLCGTLQNRDTNNKPSRELMNVDEKTLSAVLITSFFNLQSATRK